MTPEQYITQHCSHLPTALHLDLAAAYRAGQSDLGVNIELLDAYTAELREYRTNGTPTSKFVDAILRNDLQYICHNIQDEDLRCLPALCKYMHDYLPNFIWGSKEAVHTWFIAKLYSKREQDKREKEKGGAVSEGRRN